MGQAAFRASIEELKPGLFEIHYIGYMGENDRSHVDEQARAFTRTPGPFSILYCVPEMTGFHRAQIPLHGELFTAHRDRLLGIAVVGARPVVRFGSITVGLVARIKLQHFDNVKDALAWLGTLKKK